MDIIGDQDYAQGMLFGPADEIIPFISDGKDLSIAVSGYDEFQHSLKVNSKRKWEINIIFRKNTIIDVISRYRVKF